MNDPDLNAAYALDAVEEDEALAVEAALATSADDAADVARLRHAAGEYASAMTDDILPPIDLRDRVLAAARARRAPAEPTAADPREVHRIEAERFALLLRDLTPEQWSLPVDPPEFAGWTVHDLAVHVAAAETLMAQLLDVSVPGVPESDGGNDTRTAVAQARHRDLPTDTVIAEFEAAARLVDEVLDPQREEQLEALEVLWWTTPMRISTICIHRGFETWTHADDIRRAIGRAPLPPPAPSLATMSTRAAEWAGLMLAAAGHAPPPATAVIDLTGPGGGRHVTELDPDRQAGNDQPVFSIRLDVVDYCRAIANRVPPTGVRYEAEGDTELAAALVESLPALAGL